MSADMLVYELICRVLSVSVGSVIFGLFWVLFL